MMHLHLRQRQQVPGTNKPVLPAVLHIGHWSAMPGADKVDAVFVV